MDRHWKLDGHKVVPANDALDWGRSFASADRHVGNDAIGDVRISTVFLGIGHDYDPPILFETMIFGGDHDQYQERCSTWDEAEKQHAAALALVRASLQ